MSFKFSGLLTYLVIMAKLWRSRISSPSSYKKTQVQPLLASQSPHHANAAQFFSSKNKISMQAGTRKNRRVG
jgi:hypothetical protein